MSESLVCWKCGAPLTEVPLPISRYALCRACGAQLYVCRMCRHYEPRWTVGCREQRAEPVREPERANFCDWFAPRPDAFTEGGEAQGQAAKAQLEALFGSAAANGSDDAVPAAGESAVEALERLFTGKKEC